MKLKAIVHDAEEGGFWAEVPAIPGCVAQGETMEELLAHLQDAVAACLSVEIATTKAAATARIVEIAV
jgi:predicted RNase H-like HicB family nuclease